MTAEKNHHTLFACTSLSSRTRASPTTPKPKVSLATKHENKRQLRRECIFVWMWDIALLTSRAVTLSQSAAVVDAPPPRKKHATSQPASSRLCCCRAAFGGTCILAFHPGLISLRCTRVNVETQWSCTARPPLCLIKCSSRASQRCAHQHILCWRPTKGAPTSACTCALSAYTIRLDANADVYAWKNQLCDDVAAAAIGGQPWLLSASRPWRAGK